MGSGRRRIAGDGDDSPQLSGGPGGAIIHRSSRPNYLLGVPHPMTSAPHRPTNLRDLRASGWKSKSVKQEVHDNFLRALASGEELFPGIVGYEDTVIPDINLALLAQHDLLFLGEKGQGKSRLMRLIARFLDDAIPYIDLPEIPVHDDP